MRVAIVKLADYQARSLIKRSELAEDASAEELGQALLELMDEYNGLMDELGAEYDRAKDG